MALYQMLSDDMADPKGFEPLTFWSVAALEAVTTPNFVHYIIKQELLSKLFWAGNQYHLISSNIFQSIHAHEMHTFFKRNNQKVRHSIARLNFTHAPHLKNNRSRRRNKPNFVL